MDLEAIIQTIEKNESLSDVEKEETIKSAKELYRHIGNDSKQKTQEKCLTCNNLTDNVKSCEHCIRNYLEKNFNKMKSGNEKIDKLIQECQKNFKRPDNIVEWIPYSNLQNIQHETGGGIFLKVKAMWTVGKYTGWDFEKKELKRNGRQYVTIKTIDTSNPDQEQWLYQIKAHLSLSSTSSSVIRSYGLTKDPKNNTYMIITENMTYNLKNYLQDNITSLTWVQKYGILKNILQSLKCVHKNKFIHGDLTSGTIRYSTTRETWVIADFRLCRPFDDPSTENSGSELPYIAPEILKGQDEKKNTITERSDIYSFGILMWEISTGCKPFNNDINSPDLAGFIIKGSRPPVMEGTPERYSKLMKKCWDDDPEKRPNVENIQKEVIEILNGYNNYDTLPEERDELKIVKNLRTENARDFISEEPKTNEKISIKIVKNEHITNEEIFDGVTRISYATYESKKVAIKTLQIDKSDKTKTRVDGLLLNLFLEQISLWNEKVYQKPNIIEFLGIGIKDEYKLFLVMPFADNGDLREYMKKNKLNTFDEKIRIAIEIANGIKVLHENDIVHENINPKNILIFGKTAKISNLPLPFEDKDLKKKDFYARSDIFDHIGYIDPNIFGMGINSNGGDKKDKFIDIYSLGTLLWEIVSGKVPFKDELNKSSSSFYQVIKEIAKNNRREVEISNVDPIYTSLYRKCWDGSSSRRPSIDVVCDELNKLKKPLK